MAFSATCQKSRYYLGEPLNILAQRRYVYELLPPRRNSRDKRSESSSPVRTRKSYWSSLPCEGRFNPGQRVENIFMSSIMSRCRVQRSQVATRRGTLYWGPELGATVLDEPANANTNLKPLPAVQPKRFTVQHGYLRWPTYAWT